MSSLTLDIYANYNHNNSKLNESIPFDDLAQLVNFSKYLKINEYKGKFMDTILRKYFGKKDLVSMSKKDLVYNSWIVLDSETIKIHKKMLKAYSNFSCPAHYAIRETDKIDDPEIQELISLMDDEI